MSTNKRHSRGGLRPLRQRSRWITGKNERNKAARLRDREASARLEFALLGEGGKACEKCGEQGPGLAGGLCGPCIRWMCMWARPGAALPTAAASELRVRVATARAGCHRGRVEAWKQQHQRHQQRHAENLAAAALGRYKATADEQAAWHDRGGQIIAREPGVRPPFVVADRLDKRPWARLTTETQAPDVAAADSAEVKSEAPAPRPRQGRRFNPLALALCVALIGGGE
jgi:hypothetical protein